MPWITMWIPPANVEKIKVIPGVKETMPEGYGKFDQYCVVRIRNKAKENPEYEDFAHFCSQCAGWVEGMPQERNEADMGMLCGRRGVVTTCRRCGHELGFFGAGS